MTDPTPSELGRAIQDVTEKLQLLVREEIALAQAEMQQKLARLIRGVVAGSLAAVFAIFGLVYLLHAASWGIWDLTGATDNYWLGFLVTALVLFLFGAIGAALALRFVRKATPPTPAMAIEEAQLIRETVSGAHPPQPPAAVEGRS
ncbi:MAG TPA: phage holin family protein [Solirubrobacteraceae bacterium]|nr:phage holin family protein [Solirubrobacteraceae bacterium]